MTNIPTMRPQSLEAIRRLPPEPLSVTQVLDPTWSFTLLVSVIGGDVSRSQAAVHSCALASTHVTGKPAPEESRPGAVPKRAPGMSPVMPDGSTCLKHECPVLPGTASSGAAHIPDALHFGRGVPARKIVIGRRPSLIADSLARSLLACPACRRLSTSPAQGPEGRRSTPS